MCKTQLAVSCWTPPHAEGRARIWGDTVNVGVSGLVYPSIPRCEVKHPKPCLTRDRGRSRSAYSESLGLGAMGRVAAPAPSPRPQQRVWLPACSPETLWLQTRG